MRTVAPVLAWHEWWDAVAGGGGPLVVAASKQGFVLSAAQLTELGVTRARRRWAVQRGTWTSAGRGHVAPIDIRVDVADLGAAHLIARRRHALLGAGSIVARPADALSGRTAAIVHGLPTLSVPAVPELNAR